MKYLKLFENQNFDHQKLKGMIDEYDLLYKNIIDYLNFIKIDNELGYARVSCDIYQ